MEVIKEATHTLKCKMCVDTLKCKTCVDWLTLRLLRSFVQLLRAEEKFGTWCETKTEELRFTKSVAQQVVESKRQLYLQSTKETSVSCFSETVTLSLCVNKLNLPQPSSFEHCLGCGKPPLLKLYCNRRIFGCSLVSHVAYFVMKIRNLSKTRKPCTYRSVYVTPGRPSCMKVIAYESSWTLEYNAYENFCDYSTCELPFTAWVQFWWGDSPFVRILLPPTAGHYRMTARVTNCGRLTYRTYN